MAKQNIIKDLRSRKNLTQEQLAEGLQMSREMVNKMESGKRQVSAKTKLQILEKYAIDYVNKVSRESLNEEIGTTLYEKASLIAIKQILAKMMAKSDKYDDVQKCLAEIEDYTNSEMQRLLKQVKHNAS